MSKIKRRPPPRNTPATLAAFHLTPAQEAQAEALELLLLDKRLVRASELKVSAQCGCSARQNEEQEAAGTRKAAGIEGTFPD